MGAVDDGLAADRTRESVFFEQLHELLSRDARISEKRQQQSALEFLMVGNGEAGKRPTVCLRDDMAALLVMDFETCPRQSADKILP
jgi:hypothetical protein